jgi:TorA maturation chaperone TorD
MATDPLSAIPAEVIPQATAEDNARAGTYALLAALLRDVPSETLLSQLRALESPGKRDDFALAWEGLRLTARQLSPAEVDDEYHKLFIGLGRGELVPYGSWYQTGFLMERPLGVLRRDLAALGFEREASVCEPEDHVAALCEVMADLAQDPAITIDRQRDFFRIHIGPWIDRLFDDLEAAPSALFYKAVARLGSAFFGLERRYLEMET